MKQAENNWIYYKISSNKDFNKNKPGKEEYVQSDSNYIISSLIKLSDRQQ